MPSRSSLVLSVGWSLVAALVLTACSKAEPKATNATSTNSQSSASTTTAAPSSPSHSATPTVVPTKPASFNGTCVDLLPVTTLDDAIGRPIIGRTNFIVGVAEPNIGRLTYLNCKYGVSTAKVKTKMVTTTKLEIGISLYKTGDQAISRVTGTVQDYRGNGATSTDTAVGEYSGTILLGYGDPTLVVAAGPRTVAVTIASTFVPAAARKKALIDAANIALKSTQTFSQGGPVTVTDSAVPSASSS